jgi:muramoyltetrapeptide carboxypeptidase
MKFPPYLKKGDTIGLVAPAGFMPVENMQSCIETLDAWGYTVAMGATTHSQSATYFSGTDEERLTDLQQMLDDKKISAIFCARGGYGLSRMIDNLSFKKFRKNPKWIVGFSDVTVLHAHLNRQYRIASLHAPMAAAFNEGEFNSPAIQSIRHALEGQPASYETAGDNRNRQGSAKGELVGGNLALLAHLVGTPSDIRTKDKILFLEDIGEYLYNIDRMLVQLKRASKLDKLAGLIVGGFTDCKDTERPFGKDVPDIIREHVKDFDYPVCFGFPVSHEKENMALKVGGTYQLKIEDSGVSLTEI